jgi:ribonuclease HIII
VNQTLVYTLDPKQAVILQNRLRAELPPESEWRPVPYARFSVRSNGTVLTCYESGKVVVQGAGAQMLAARFLGTQDAVPVVEEQLPAEILETRMGSDEVGKGDYFGPLVVVAAYVDPVHLPEMRQMGVTDSKKIGDDRVRRMAGMLAEFIDHVVLTLEPEAYNARYAVVRNVNRMLAELHARALQELMAKRPAEAVIVDRFGDERDMLDAFADLGIRTRGPRYPSALKVHQVVQAERHPAVAAASIIARARFLAGLQHCVEASASDLPKGAGENVDAAARRVVAVGGKELLGKVAKLHFRNTQRVMPMQST